MTPAELIAWAGKRSAEADAAQKLMDESEWSRQMRGHVSQEIADLRLAARLARLVAERGGLEENDGTA